MFMEIKQMIMDMIVIHTKRPLIVGSMTMITSTLTRCVAVAEGAYLVEFNNFLITTKISKVIKLTC